MKCKNCDNEEINKKKNLCGACLAKEYRKNNPEKIKAYLERSEKRIREWSKNYYKENKEKIKSQLKEIGQTEEFKKRRREKSKTMVEQVRRSTRTKHPLEGQKCIKCDLEAKHRHHTTNPPEVDKFLFLCHKHHMEEHGKNSYALTKDGEK